MVPTAIRTPPGTLVDPDSFKGTFRDHPAGVTVITADDGSGPVALTATSVVSVSTAPAMLIFSVSDLSSSTRTIRDAETVVVHFLAADQLNIALLGATHGIDRFADAEIWERLPTGEPHFPAAQSWIRGRVVKQVAAGNSTVIFVEAMEVKAPQATGDRSDEPAPGPLVYHDRTWHRLSKDSVIR